MSGPHPRHDDEGGASPSAVEATATGTVQGVGFRYLTRQRAEALGLTGSAVNLQDGSVRVIAQGPEESVAELLDWLRSPEAPGRVEGLGVRQIEPDPEALGFDVG